VSKYGGSNFSEPSRKIFGIRKKFLRFFLVRHDYLCKSVIFYQGLDNEAEWMSRRVDHNRPVIRILNVRLGCAAGNGVPGGGTALRKKRTLQKKPFGVFEKDWTGC